MMMVVWCAIKNDGKNHSDINFNVKCFFWNGAKKKCLYSLFITHRLIEFEFNFIFAVFIYRFPNILHLIRALHTISVLIKWICHRRVVPGLYNEIHQTTMS